MSRNTLPVKGVVTKQTTLRDRGLELANRLGIDLLSAMPGDPCLVLELSCEKLSLIPVNTGLRHTLHVEFSSGKSAYRVGQSKHTQERIARAVGAAKNPGMRVFDATAGLGQDGFLLAAAGCRVTMLEQHPVLYELLLDGLHRASQTIDLVAIVQRIELVHGKAEDHMQALEKGQNIPDCIYLDPMFPVKKKSALPPGPMQILHLLLGESGQGQGLLALALGVAKRRVVVKRGIRDPFLDEMSPGHQLKGKTSRFDIYPV